ncbi:MAG TPA: DUF4012 domain-containing protein [Acidimicrobiales bacterium]|nr:DUF4012 domain-containing protein [Acidimicrobiales bacterium]
MSIALRRPEIFATRRSRTVAYGVAVAGTAVAAAVLTNAQPTGLDMSDMFWSAALVAALASLGATARRWTWFLPAGAGALLAGNGVAMACAGVAIVIAFVSVLRNTRSRARGALVSGLGGIALLRAGPVGFHGLTAIITFAAIVPAMVSGYEHASRRVRHRARRIAAIGAGVIGLMLAGAALGVLSVQKDLAAGIRGIDDGIAAARDVDDELAAEQLDAAARSLTSAEGTLTSWFVSPARSLPVIGPNLDAIGSLAAQAGDVAEVSSLAASSADVDALHFTDGRLDPQVVADMEGPLAQVRSALESMQAEVDDVQSPWLLSLVTSRVDRLEEQVDGALPDAELAENIVSIAPKLLGTEGPQRYLVFFTTPVEARGRIGFPGNYAELVVDNGQLSMPVFGRVAELEAAGSGRTLTGPADMVSRYARFDIANTWRNLTMTPDFPSFALAANELYQQSGGQRIDGVISVDPAGLAAVMRLIGEPVQVAGRDEPLTADTAEEFLLSGQYSEYEDDNEQRLEVLDEVARTTFRRLTTADLPGPRSLSRSLDPVVDGGHIMFAPLDPGAYLVVSNIGVTGDLPAPDADEDSLLVTTTNAAANKADLFLQRREQYSVRWDPDTGQLQSTLRLTLENQAPAEGFPDYVLGNAVGLPRGTNRSFVSIYSPFALEAARIGGQPAALQAEVELGRNVYSTFVDIPPGASVDIEVDLSGVIGGRRYVLDIPVQPFAKPDEATVTVEVVDGIAASREADVEGNVATWSGTLDRDRHVAVSAPRN